MNRKIFNLLPLLLKLIYTCKYWKNKCKKYFSFFLDIEKSIYNNRQSEVEKSRYKTNKIGLYGIVLNKVKYLIFIIVYLFCRTSLKANDFKLIISFEKEFYNNLSTEEDLKNYIPTYKGINIPEAQIKANNLEDIKYNVLSDNEAGNVVNEAYNTRVRYDTNQMGNILKNTEKINTNADTIVNKDYCDPYNDVEYKVCYRYRGNNSCANGNYDKHCESNLELKCIKYESGCTTGGLELSSLPSDLQWVYNSNSKILTVGKKSSSNYWSGKCLVIDKTIEFNVGNLALVELFSLNKIVVDDYMSITLNDNLIYVAPDNGTQLIITNGKVNDGLGIKPCERGKLWQQNINRDLTKLLKLGKNILKIRVVVSGTGQASLEFLLKNRCCVEYVEKWTEICANKNNYSNDKCKLISKLCTKKDVKMVFEGKNLNKKCTTYDISYNCKSNENSCLMHDDDCSVYDVSGCSLESKEFMDKARTLEKFTYRCLTPRDTKKDCNKQINCLEGNCYDLAIADDNRQDMQKALTVLTTLDEAVKTIDIDNLTMLKGENLKCRKSTGAIASFKDCCGDTNWGNKLSGCSPAEEKLKAKRENNDCIYVGSYCSDYKNLGIGKICITKKYSYCCFSNKFSKIIGNALRQQGLQNWGNAKNTNCNGILINNLNRLDFNKIDFSELYSAIKTNVNQKAIDEKIRQNLERLKNVK